MLSATCVAYLRGNIDNFRRTQRSAAGGSAGEGAGAGDPVGKLGGVPYDVLGERAVRGVLLTTEVDAPRAEAEAEQAQPRDAGRDHPRQLEGDIDGAGDAVPAPDEHPERHQGQQREYAHDL